MTIRQAEIPVRADQYVMKSRIASRVSRGTQVDLSVPQVPLLLHMLLHQLREHLMLVAELCLELLNPFAFGPEFFARLLLECRGAVLKELLLPAV